MGIVRRRGLTKELGFAISAPFLALSGYYVYRVHGKIKCEAKDCPKIANGSVGIGIGQATKKKGWRLCSTHMHEFYTFPSPSVSENSIIKRSNVKLDKVNPKVESPGLLCHDPLLMEWLTRQIEALSWRDREIFHLRWIAEKSLDEIGIKLHISKERVRQIEIRVFSAIARKAKLDGIEA